MRFILQIIFYLIITPLGLILRLFGIKLIELKWDKSKNTYWNKKKYTV